MREKILVTAEDVVAGMCSTKRRVLFIKLVVKAAHVLVAFVLLYNDDWRGIGSDLSERHDPHVRPISKDNFRTHHHFSELVGCSTDR